MIVDVTDFEVQVAASAAGPFALIDDLTSGSATHGTEGSARTRVFGRTTPYIRAGDDTDEYSLDGLYNPADTDGQNVLRDAKNNKTTVVIAVLHDATSGAEKGYTQECRVTEYGESADSDGEYVECSFTLEAVGERADVPNTGLPVPGP